MKNALVTLVAVLLIADALKALAAKIPAGSRIFMAAMEGGLDGFIAPEMIKKHSALKVVTDEQDADYVPAGASSKADDKCYHTVFGGKDKNEGNVRLLSVKDKSVVWAGETGDRSMWYGGRKGGGERKIADRIVSRMKRDLF